MAISKKEYDRMTKNASPPSPKIKDFVCSFLVGGLICVLGQLLGVGYSMLPLEKMSVKALVSITLIFLAVLLTMFGIFDKIAKHAGAGTLVPITGFANAVAAPAIEYKKEGFILGIGANMFKIAGPVIVYGTVASVIYGIVYWITTLF